VKNRGYKQLSFELDGTTPVGVSEITRIYSQNETSSVCRATSRNK